MRRMMMKKFRVSVAVVFAIVGVSCFCNCDGDSVFALTEYEEGFFAQNNNLFYDPTCSEYGNTDLPTSFKVDSTVNPWYAEGDVIETYYGGFNGPGLLYWSSSSAPQGNKELYYSTKEDPSMGNMQYVYAEQYDVTWNGDFPVFKKNGSNSQTKYYWVVLPDTVYTNSAGELFVATFEKLSEPVHFIVLDVHSCNHQNICKEAKNKDYVGGKGLLGGLSSNSGDLYGLTGGITGLHRIKGKSKTFLSEFSTSGLPVASDANVSMPACSGQGNGDIGASALALAWPMGTEEKKYKSSATDEFAKFWKTIPYKLKPDESCKEGGKSCDNFVGATIRYSGLDNNAPLGLTGLFEHIKNNNNWEKVYEGTEIGEESNYQDGDVIFYYGDKKNVELTYNGDYLRHVAIYTKDGNGKGYIVEASSCKHYGVTKEFYPNEDYDRIRIYRNKNNKKGAENGCDVCAGQENGNGELKDGGYDSVEEAEAAMISAYKKEADPKKLGAFRCKTSYDNCVTFSKWFIEKYTGMDSSVIMGDGRDIADNFYNAYHGKYPELKKSSTPSVYSIASWKTVMSNTTSGNHTGVVVGVDQATNTILIAEAGYCNPEFTGVHKYKLSDFNGKGVYVNINAYMKSGGLK